MAGEIDAALRRRVSERADHLCEYCLVHEDDTYLACEVDHILSLKHGGLTAPENLAFACFDCNRHKGGDVGSVAGASREFVRFFNPRLDKWTGHFFLDRFKIVPLTEIGEATARILQFNNRERLLRRGAVIEAGRYPGIAALARLRD